ncbi:uncharacterized protein [Physcomitrium patens]|uniref:Germin-like protein n=1 Tax=Physcomitrium patens TaxID=3218 RepID=A0A2K1IBH6_PHYPA|nr:spherulin-1A-like [Physcomitrium patens]PNR26625.1 hypothetical protein PHYPA_030106 [Physcomitrium patens]|eukprot:XP_024366967.1 spherulin-1A-like [Physcomitrella patens]
MTTMKAFSLLLAALSISLCSAQTTLDMNDLDFIPEVRQRSLFTAAGFIYKFETVTEKTVWGDLRTMFVNVNPSLATLPGEGAAQNLVKVGPCAINQPHNHPRATEISHITEGELLFGFAEENGGRPFIGGNATKGQTVIVPQGVIHFAQNLGCKQAQFIASFPNRDPGTQTTASTFFRLPLSAIRATTGLSEKEIQKIMKSVSGNVNPSLDLVCAKRCSMAY